MARPMYHLARVRASLSSNARRHKQSLRALRPPKPSGPARSLDVLPDKLVFDRSDWVSAWIDPRNMTVSPCGTVTACRAISTAGRLLWVVRKSGLKRAYHSREKDAQAAIADAENAWQRRHDQKVFKPQVRAIVSDLRWLRVRHPVLIDDAYRSPLCDEGIDCFLRALRISGFRSYPGWLVGWLFAIDRQVGFVLWEAHLRVSAAAGDNKVTDLQDLSCPAKKHGSI
ncbi:hypothetical protein [Roseobacter weihaiensis]|uniref:hypothetical protein n=1 Tax=Roseobacter weihaiensis TaxID=2763262 RepID=UPI001D09D82C|nr:hypothetical protein [Roseobacter sp. H9]